MPQDNFGLVPSALRAALEKEGSAAEIRKKNKGVPKVKFFVNLYLLSSFNNRH